MTPGAIEQAERERRARSAWHNFMAAYDACRNPTTDPRQLVNAEVKLWDKLSDLDRYREEITRVLGPRPIGE